MLHPTWAHLAKDKKLLRASSTKSSAIEMDAATQGSNYGKGLDIARCDSALFTSDFRMLISNVSFHQTNSHCADKVVFAPV